MRRFSVTFDFELTFNRFMVNYLDRKLNTRRHNSKWNPKCISQTVFTKHVNFNRLHGIVFTHISCSGWFEWRRATATNNCVFVLFYDSFHGLSRATNRNNNINFSSLQWFLRGSSDFVLVFFYFRCC